VRDAGLAISIRSGGHQIAGHAVANDTVMLDLSHMRSVHVDPAEKTARVAPGALLGDVDRETQAHGLVVPLGINSTTGTAGLTLGGGFGWTTRKLGMTIDNLLSAEVVTADGAIITASPDSHPDLFWAICGGGGNFGVVTSFLFQLHDLGPEVLSGLVVHPIEAAPELLAEFVGIADVIAPHSFVDWQAAFDPLLTSGARNYWKSHDFETLSTDAVDMLLAGIGSLPDPACEVFIAHVGGVMARVAPDATAYPQRSAHFIMNVHTRWEDPKKDAECIAWARKLHGQMQPFATGSAYVNFMPEDETDPLGGAYGGNAQKLSQIKGKYDPNNLFRINHNIMPT
jgi:FAD/FMN-containing dehydrogenase